MERQVIFDVGMHKAEDTEFYLKKGFNVVAVEADPDLAQSAEDRLSSYVRSGQLKVINKAITREPGPVTFYRSKNVTDWGTINPEWAARNLQLGADIVEITVPGIQFSQLLVEYDAPYYVKIDIEGADRLCLESLLEGNSRPKFISIESSKVSFDDLFEEFVLFTRLGYWRFKIIPQHQIGSQMLPNPSREGCYVDHTFPTGSSGSFGLELPGEWLSLESAIRKYLKIFGLYRLTGDSSRLSKNKLVRQTLNQGRGRQSVSNLLVRKIIKPIGTKLGLRPGWYDTHAMYPKN